ncbi:segregation and condensation protein B [Neiella marina]|uniref:Segregation and condensation protein B n=1 Tax=Neiella marina TaxID=508461 RepID=A0A8J2U3E9_9GAMM|nr:SMC-Scp complex subunit ScpB [Neiella marina]GGA69567.1 segregation and condensation protein B [Neiella marina]
MAKPINDDQLAQVIEAALFVADQPMTPVALRDSVLQQFAVPLPRIREALERLRQDYLSRGVNLIEVASGFRFQTAPVVSEQIALMWTERAPRYSRATLETLSLIAYRQPITRAEIEDVRGVSVSSQIMKTLQERGWIKSVGHKEVPGRPSLWATTAEFLDYFGLKSLSDLPELDMPENARELALANEYPLLNEAESSNQTEAKAKTERANTELSVVAEAVAKDPN